ncbi:MAG: hypothetical protein HUJ75_08695, partial [Parasporobacterium sp.]|nr:hypothetical protein [Parasporobacterium sp.]
KNIISAAGKDAVIGTYNDPSWDVSFNADYNFTRTDVTGGASVSKGCAGTGSAAGYIILKDNVIAFLDEGLNVNADSLKINANRYTRINEIIANGARVANPDGTFTAAISPVLVYVENTTGAYLHTDKDNKDNASDKSAVLNLDKDLSVTAKDETKIIIVSGAPSVPAANKGVGGSLQAEIIKKTVEAIIGRGTSENNRLTATVKGDTTVNADSGNALYSIAVGLAGASEPDASGSVIVLYNADEITSRTGDYFTLNYNKEGGDITVNAHEKIYLIFMAGELGFSYNAWADGPAYTEVLLKGSVTAEVGKDAYIKGNNIRISADSENEIYQMAIAGTALSSGNTADLSWRDYNRRNL